MRTIKLAILCWTLTSFLFAAEDPFVGPWKINAAKSKFPPGAPGFFSGTMQLEAAGDRLKSTAAAADSEGIASNFTFNCSLDGTPCKVTTATSPRSASAVDTIPLKRTDPMTIMATGTRRGKTVYSDRRTVSQDGRTMTALRQGTTPEGKKYQSTVILERFR